MIQIEINFLRRKSRNIASDAGYRSNFGSILINFYPYRLHYFLEYKRNLGQSRIIRCFI